MKKTLLALILAGVSTTVAADSLIYGGAQVAQGSYLGEDSTAYGVHVGTGILPFIGLEVGYWDFGSYDFGPSLDTDITSFNVAVKPSIDLGPVHLYGKVGLHSWDMDGYRSDDGYDMLYGAGLEYNIIPMITLGAGYNYFTLGDENIDAVSLNLTLHFL